MLYGYSLDVKEQIRQAINIVDLAGEYIQLTPKGRIYVGLCPWHDDSKPSLQIDPERQTFRCWVCADGGDIFSFMMKIENVSFPEALQMLAERAGIELPKQSAKRHSHRRTLGPSSGRGENAAGAADPSTEEAADEFSSYSGKKRLHEAAFWAETEYFEHFRSLPETHPAKIYLAERGISAENVEKFRIGFAPDAWNWLENRAGRKRELVKDLCTTGYLGYSQERKSYFERFRGRLLFPIHDSRGRSVGIGGRVIPGIPTMNESAKYLNTPETPLFSKHRLLYGLDLARRSIQKKKRVLVMEGYTDTIIAHQYGFTESVAVLGTALGVDHIRMLNRIADTIYLVLDGDEAGQRRAAQVLELFVAEKTDVQILTLPEENDPAEYLAEYGAEAFEELLQTRTNDALTHAFLLHTRNLDFHNIHQSEQALEKLLGLIAQGKKRSGGNDFGVLSFREEKMLQQLAFSFSISEDFLRRKLREICEKTRHEAQLRSQWQEQREAQNQLRELISADRPSAQQGDPDRPANLRLDESEAYAGDEELFFDDTPDLEGTFSGSPAQIQTGMGDGTPLDEDPWSLPEPTAADHSQTPALLTQEAFDLYADELDWAVFGKMNAWEKEIIEILFAWPTLLPEVRSRTTPERFLYVPARELFLRMCEMADEGKDADFTLLLTSFESETMKRWMIQTEADSIWNQEKRTEEEVLRLLDTIMASFEQFYLMSRKPQDLSIFHSSKLNRDQKLDLLEQLIQEKQRKNGIRSVDPES
ncbi:MAG: toprim domain-containing protein [Thermoguttaceae bacterium]|nr:toprim domain-containing protein [Thermoguttaceae bacterium]